MIEAAVLIIQIKPAISDQLSKAFKLDRDNLSYAQTKIIEALSKSLLTRCLPYDTQDDFTKLIAQKLGLQSRD